MKNLYKKIAVTVVAMACAMSVASAAERGTKEEAVAMVKRAVLYLKANGKEKAYAEFMSPNGSFQDRDLSITATRIDGLSMAHQNPRVVGKNVIDLKDVDGKMFIRGYIEVAKSAGHGWVDYKWPNPVTKAVESKSTYVELVDDIMLGCGVYKSN